LTVVESFETADSTASISLGKSSFAELRRAAERFSAKLANPRHKDQDPDGTTGDAPADTSVRVVVQDATAASLAFVAGLVAPLLSVLVTTGVVIVFVCFMLIGREDLRNRVIRVIGPGQMSLTTQVLDDAAERISRYLQMQLIVNGSYGLTLAAGLYFIGIPNAALWGFLAAVLRYVPYVGPWVAAAFPMALSLVAFPDNSWWHPLETATLFIVLELLSNNVLEPVLYGSSTGISTIGIVVAAVFWTWLWGAIGLVLSTPLTVCIAVLGRHVPQLEFFDVLLSDEDMLEPHANYYQRLLAGDLDESNRIIEKQLEEKTVVEVYDTVVLPALALAENDSHRGLLDEVKLEYIRDSIRELIEEMGERMAASAAAVEPSSERSPEEPLPHHSIVCLPARDEADELAAMMLVQLLEARGLSAHAASVRSLASEMLDQVAEQDAGIICISAVPPLAATHARYLCKRARGRFPDVKLVIGLWTTGNGKKAEERLKSACADRVFTNLSQAVDQIS